MRGVEERPSGLRYSPDLLSEAEENALVQALEHLDFRTVTMRGQEARRTVRHFGFDYGYESWQLVPGDPLPDYLEEARGRCAALMGTEPEALAQVLVTRYPPGATIGWHRDAPMFGPAVAGLSLAAPCVMRFQHRPPDGERRVFEQPLARRSAYVLEGPARSSWQHSIPAVPDLRYSVTFRTLRDPARWG